MMRSRHVRAHTYSDWARRGNNADLQTHLIPHMQALESRDAIVATSRSVDLDAG